MEKKMKATLEFDLPEDNDSFKMATRGGDYFCVLWDLKELLRQKRKYGMEEDDFEQQFEDLIDNAILDDIC